jgi:hypothetical protein
MLGRNGLPLAIRRPRACCGGGDGGALIAPWLRKVLASGSQNVASVGLSGSGLLRPVGWLLLLDLLANGQPVNRYPRSTTRGIRPGMLAFSVAAFVPAARRAFMDAVPFDGEQH